MRAVTTATAALAIGVPRKSLDNILAKLALPEAPKGRQGLERRLPVTILPHLFIVAELVTRLEMPVRTAHELALQLVSGRAEVGAFLSLRLDPASIRTAVDLRLADAIEHVVRRPRGRPRTRSTRLSSTEGRKLGDASGG